MCEALSVHYSELPRCILSSTKLKVEISKQNTKFYNKNLEYLFLVGLGFAITSASDSAAYERVRTSCVICILRSTNLPDRKEKQKKHQRSKG